MTEESKALAAAEFDASQRAMRTMLGHVKRQIELHSALLRDYQRLQDTLTDMTDPNYVTNVFEFEQIKRNLTPTPRPGMLEIPRDLDEQ